MIIGGAIIPLPLRTTKDDKMYEYMTLNGDDLISAEQLNELAGDGWEFIQAVPYNNEWCFYFRRMQAAH